MAPFTALPRIPLSQIIFKRNFKYVASLVEDTFVHSVPVFDNGNAEEVYDPQSLDDIMSLLQPQPSKRGWCRNGFSYSPVLRRCQPSISMLRAGRVGRRRGF